MDDWSTKEHTQVIGKLGYLPKEDRQPGSSRRRGRENDTRAWKRAKKGNPFAKAAVILLVLAVVGGGAWWYLSQEEEQPEEVEGLSLADDSCSYVDGAPLSDVVNLDQREVSTENVDSDGEEQTCVVAFGDLESAYAQVTTVASLHSSPGSAEVRLSYKSDMDENGAWESVDTGQDDSVAYYAPAESGDSANYQLFMVHDNAILNVQLYVTRADSSVEDLATWAEEIANSYLSEWD